MKNTHLAIMAIALSLVAVGCDKKSDTMDNPPGTDTNSSTANQTMQNAKESATNAWEKTKEATTNAWDATKTATANAWTDIKQSLGTASDYTYDKKDEFVAKAQADLDSLDQKIASMTDKADASLKEKRAALDQKLTDAKNATQDGWNNARDSFVSAYDDVKTSIKQAWSGSSTNSP